MLIVRKHQQLQQYMAKINQNQDLPHRTLRLQDTRRKGMIQALSSASILSIQARPAIADGSPTEVMARTAT
jgi:hypothetical protein